ncbi:bifunctional diguanylate cyclase/phosphodiesterase [Agaribacter flavus]|uniref:EAL domain-containing protein n=1 Tax=Agaribacter flavus TaxID=1902781 RepID=A0ABV7FPJ3_9ALTE
MSKQLATGFLIILTLVFVGTFLFNAQNTRVYIQQQLESHAQDTATSLGLSITPYIGDEESSPIVETMLQAIFDRGYYQAIVLLDNNNETIFSLEQTQTQNSVPTWFIHTFPLIAPSAETTVNDGWTIKGRLIVTSNLGLGYRQLYSNAKHSLFIFTVALIVTMLFLSLLVQNIVTKPLGALIRQANDISNRHFSIIQTQPKTPELSKITLALNKMSKALSAMFKQMTLQIDEYRRYAYEDSLTKTGNRRAFEMSLDVYTSKQSVLSHGFLFIIKASSLGEIHRQFGGDIGDNYLIELVDVIRSQTSKDYKNQSIYRLNGAEFAIIFEDIDEKLVSQVAKTIIQKTRRLEKSEHKNGFAHIGITRFERSSDKKKIFEQADSALTIAYAEDARWHMCATETVSHSNYVWREKLEEIITNRTAEFVCQPIKRNNGDVLYEEWFARLPDKRSSISSPMNQLISASIKLGYSLEIDKLIVVNLLKAAKNSDSQIGLNVSRFSLLNEEFNNWFTEMLTSYGSTCPKLVLEIPERALVQDVSLMQTFCKNLKALGVKITIEHFGAQLAGIAHLSNIRPDYLKIDGRFTRNIHLKKENQLFVNSLTSIAKGLSISVIAEMIESEEELIWLKTSGVELFQGYFIEEPK